MTVYNIDPRIDDICELNKVVSTETCEKCKYCHHIEEYSNVVISNIHKFSRIRIICNYGH